MKKTGVGSLKCLNFPGSWSMRPTENEAMAKAEVLALRVLAEQIEQGEARPQPIRFVMPAA